MSRYVTVTLTDAQAVSALQALEYFRDGVGLPARELRRYLTAERAIEAARDRSGPRRISSTLPDHG